MEVVVGRSHITALWMKHEGSFRTWSWHERLCRVSVYNGRFIAFIENGLGKSKVFISSCTLALYSIIYLSCSNLIVCFTAWSSVVTLTMPEVNATVEETYDRILREKGQAECLSPRKILTR